jgi:hypothetical protein
MFSFFITGLYFSAETAIRWLMIDSLYEAFLSALLLSIVAECWRLPREIWLRRVGGNFLCSRFECENAKRFDYVFGRYNSSAIVLQLKLQNDGHISSIKRKRIELKRLSFEIVWKYLGTLRMFGEFQHAVRKNRLKDLILYIRQHLLFSCPDCIVCYVTCRWWKSGILVCFVFYAMWSFVWNTFIEMTFLSCGCSLPASMMHLKS